MREPLVHIDEAWLPRSRITWLAYRVDGEAIVVAITTEHQDFHVKVSMAGREPFATFVDYAASIGFEVTT